MQRWAQRAGGARRRVTLPGVNEPRAILAALASSVALGSPAAAQSPPAPAPAPPPPPRIAAGVHAGGVDVGGLTVPEAAAKLGAALGPRLRRPVTIRVAKRRFRLRPRRVGLRFDAPRTARRAYRAGLAGPLAGGFGDPVDVPVAVALDRRRLRRYVASLGRAVFVAPRNATLRITLRRMIRRRSYGGRRLVQYRLRNAIVRTLRNPKARRVLTARRRRVAPAITYRDLARRNPTVLTVDRGGFRLRLFKRLRYARSYPIAVGAAGHDTPAGLFRITSKQVNPAWHAPNRPWAGSYAGRTVPGGAPVNPLKPRWLGIAGGVGIHGTAEPWSIGSRASHGCIRMRVRDVIDLYPRVPLGTQVLIR